MASVLDANSLRVVLRETAGGVADRAPLKGEIILGTDGLWLSGFDRYTSQNLYPVLETGLTSVVGGLTTELTLTLTRPGSPLLFGSHFSEREFSSFRVSGVSNLDSNSQTIVFGPIIDRVDGPSAITPGIVYELSIVASGQAAAIALLPPGPHTHDYTTDLTNIPTEFLTPSTVADEAIFKRWNESGSEWTDDFIRVKTDTIGNIIGTSVDGQILKENITDNLVFYTGSQHENVISQPVLIINAYDSIDFDFNPTVRWIPGDISGSAGSLVWPSSIGLGTISLQGSNTNLNASYIGGKPAILVNPTNDSDSTKFIELNLGTTYNWTNGATVVLVCADVDCDNGSSARMINILDASSSVGNDWTLPSQLAWCTGGATTSLSTSHNDGGGLDSFVWTDGSPISKASIGNPSLIILTYNAGTNNFKTYVNQATDVIVVNTTASNMDGVQARRIGLGYQIGGYGKISVSEVLYWDSELNGVQLTNISNILLGEYGLRTEIITSLVDEVLITAKGGTHNFSYVEGDLLVADSSSLVKLAAVATGNVLVSTGVATQPSWGQVALDTHMSDVNPDGGIGTVTGDRITSLVNSGYPFITKVWNNLSLISSSISFENFSTPLNIPNSATYVLMNFAGVLQPGAFLMTTNGSGRITSQDALSWTFLINFSCSVTSSNGNELEIALFINGAKISNSYVTTIASSGRHVSLTGVWVNQLNGSSVSGTAVGNGFCEIFIKHNIGSGSVDVGSAFLSCLAVRLQDQPTS